MHIASRHILRMLLLSVLLSASGSAQSSIVTSKHNMSASSSATIKAASEQQVCVFCHTPHSAQSTGALWNRQQPTGSYTLYSSDYLTSKSYPSALQPNAKSKLCLSCHDGTIALGAVYNAPGASTSITMAGSVTTMPTGTDGHLGTDLGDDHPVGFGYAPSLDPELVSRSWPWNTAVALDPDNASGRIECHSCHDAHDNQYGSFLQMANTNASLCLHCHSKTGWNGSGVIHRSSTQAYTPPGASTTTIGEWACRNCHRSHSGGSGPYLLAETEEATCLQANCHGASAPSTTSDIATQYNRSSKHPTTTLTGVHKNPETATYMSTNRHAECWDCHNGHELEEGVHDGSSRLISGTGGSGVLKGVWGVEPSYGSVPSNSSNNDNVFSTISSYSVVDPATKEYQICLKCHSDYLSGTQRNIAEEIDPRYSSYHGLITGGTSNAYCNANTLEAPWASNTDANGNRIVWCSDCHGSSDSGTPPKGPHGSNADNLLVASAVSSSTSGTPLCFVCHKLSVYWSGGGGGNSNFPQHAGVRTQHRTATGCFSCHMYDYSDYPTGTGGNTRRIFVHGMNKWFNKRETGSNVTGTGQAANAFMSGYIADMDFVNRSCWSESVSGQESATNCGMGHNARSY